jgi:GntR family transcriptional regulator
VTSALPVLKYHQIYLVQREQLHEGRSSNGVPGEIALMRVPRTIR